MAGSRRSAKNSLGSQLYAEPFRFSFVQAVRILEQMSEQDTAAPRIGSDLLPDQECVRLAALATRSFASSEVVDLIAEKEAPDGQTSLPPKLIVAFMGLFGPSGVLPHHDTQRIIDNGNKDTAERDFLNVFNHRLMSLFYRASVKYRLPIQYEAGIAHEEGEGSTSAFLRAFYSFVGQGTGGLRGRLDIPDEVSIEYSGVFSQRPKNANSLQRMLASVFSVPVAVQQHVGRWLNLSEENQSAMPTLENPNGQHCALGQSFILGERVWDVTSKFRICIGPLDKVQFESFLPHRTNLARLCQMVRLYVGVHLDFDVQLELNACEVPPIQLGTRSSLGNDTWLLSQPPGENKSDTVLENSGKPVGEVQHAAA